MNWIQQHVLVELARHGARRYSQLRPDGVEGNLFLYHLGGLVKDGLVEKTGQDYRFSNQGLHLAGLLSLETGQVRQQPKILNALVCNDASGRYLLSRWHRQPNTGLVSFPHGMMHFGVAHHDMAVRELAEKAGLSATLDYRGQVYLRGYRDGEIDRHMLVHLFRATGPRPAPGQRPDVAEPFWEHLENVPADQFVPGFGQLAQIVQAAGADQPVYGDIAFDVA